MTQDLSIHVHSDRIRFVTVRSTFLFFPADVIRINTHLVPEFEASASRASSLSYFANNQLYMAKLTELSLMLNLQLLRINKRAHKTLGMHNAV